MRPAMPHLRRTALTAAALGLWAAAPAPAQAAPKLVSFRCHIDGGRTRVLPRAQEMDRYDELLCRVRVKDLGGRSARDLAVELRLLTPDGSYRVVATAHLEPAAMGRGRAQIDELAVPHASWVAGIDWQQKRPGVRLMLHLLDRPSPGSKSWRLLAERQLQVGGSPQPPRVLTAAARARSPRKR